jgi:hypothetical protein
MTKTAQPKKTKKKSSLAMKREAARASKKARGISVKNLMFRVLIDPRVGDFRDYDGRAPLMIERENEGGLLTKEKGVLRYLREQVYRVHQFKNEYRRLERERRESFSRFIVSLDRTGSLKALADEYVRSEQEVDAAYYAAKQDRVRTRSKRYAEEFAIAIMVAKAARKNAYKAFSEARKPLIERWKEECMAAKERIYGVDSDGKVCQYPPNTARKYRIELMEWQCSKGDCSDLDFDHASKEMSNVAFCDLNSGSRLIAERSMKDVKTGGPPKALKFDGSGAIGVQVSGGGCTIRGMFCGEEHKKAKCGRSKGSVPGITFSKIGEFPGPSGKEDVVLRSYGSDERIKEMRIFSIALGKAGVLRLPVILHRALNPDAVVKWASVQQSRIGSKYQYHIMLTIEETVPKVETGAKGAVCVSFGSDLVSPDRADMSYDLARMSDAEEFLRAGDHRVAIMTTSSASFRDEEMGSVYSVSNRNHADVELRDGVCELTICPREVRKKTSKVSTDGRAVYKTEHRHGIWTIEDRQSEIDQRFNAIKQQITEFRKSKKSRPEWFQEKTESCVHWRNPVRAIEVYYAMDNDRFRGCEELLAALEDWVRWHTKYNNDLRAFDMRMRKDRDNFYRSVARALSNRYEHCVVKKEDLSEENESPDELSAGNKNKNRAKKKRPIAEDRASLDADNAKNSVADIMGKYRRFASNGRFRQILKEVFGDRLIEVACREDHVCPQCGAESQMGAGGRLVCTGDATHSPVDLMAYSLRELEAAASGLVVRKVP